MTRTETCSDLYPSRVGAGPERLARRDPVVYDFDIYDDNVGPLTAAQLRTFADDGFLVLPGLLDAAEADHHHREARRLAEAPSIRDSERSIVEPQSDEVRSVFAVHEHDDVFRSLASDHRLTGIARQILGSGVYVHQSRINLKPGFRGREFYWHSDFETWHVEDGMPRMRAVSCSLLLTRNETWNGPLMIIPGSHVWFVACAGQTPPDHYQQSLRKQEYGVPDDENLRWLVEQSGIAAPTGDPGTVVFFDCNAMHGSNGNITPLPRANAFIVYNSLENCIEDPFGGQPPRPTFIASRDFTPV